MELAVFYRTMIVKLALFLSTVVVLAACGEAAQGPLRPHPDNPRYFTYGTRSPNGSLKAIYLTGSHTWNNLIDLSRQGERFDFEKYLNFLQKHHHNFTKLWTWESTKWDTRANKSLAKDFIHQAAPHPWARTGPGEALDGKPKFDLTEFNPAYFQRLRSRVAAAGERGIYVAVMLFEGWGLTRGNRRSPAEEGWAWQSHPFNPANNVNSIKIEGADTLSGRVHTLANPEVNELQAAYIRKVVDTLNDLDNVLYEVINEGGEQEWDWWVVKTIRDHERTKPKRHPIGITGHGAEKLESMLASPADWISPGRKDGYGKSPPAWEGKKVSIIDTDHIWGVGGNEAWVWKSFLGGHNPIFMDPYDGSVLGKRDASRWKPIRNALGQTRRLAERIHLQAMVPHPELASTGFCLARPGTEYLVYQPQPRKTFSLKLKPGSYRFEWIDPTDGNTVQHGDLKGVSGTTEFKPPLNGAAVLYLKAH